jgi:ceramide glucosyltransferase
LPKIVPRVAVLKPLRGLGVRLVESLISYLELDYPRVEYLFGVASYADRAAEAPVALREQYRFKPMTLVIGEEPGCTNRKVAKLIKLGDRAPNAEFLVISDADISVERDHLRRVAGELSSDERAAIVTCLYRARPHGTLASRLEALAVNTDFAPQVMVSSAVEPIRYAFGATIAIKRAALEEIGGFRALKDVLADDFYLGKLVTDRGHRIRLSSSLVTTVAYERTFADFWNHQLRWARTYRTARPLSLATILIHGPFWAFVMLAASGGKLFAIKALILVLAARMAMSALMLSRVLLVPELIRDVWLVPIKDLCMSAVWFASLLSNKVVWAGRRLEILPDGKMLEVDG